MTRLSNYLIKLFSAEAAALFGVALTILYLAQTLRIVDVDAVRDRGIGTLLWQTVLALPPLAIAFLYVCIAIGLARGLRNLQASRELHIIHAAQMLPMLIRTVLTYAALGVLAVLLLSHVIEPAAKREANLLRAGAAADLVGRSLVPNRFVELGEGVTITVGGRGQNGEITTFFADDRRNPETRRTYMAASALITSDELGYVLQLRDGAVQYRRTDGQFTEISFDRYDIALERLTGEADIGERRGDLSTYAMVADALATGEWPDEYLRRIAERTADAFRVLGLCLFVFAIAGFPSGRRKPLPVPLEIVVLGAVLCERTVMTYLPLQGWQQQVAPVVLLIAVSLVMLLARLRVFGRLPREAHSA